MKVSHTSGKLRLALAAGAAAFAIPAASAGAAVISTTSAGTGAPPSTLGGFALTPFASNPANDGATISSVPSPSEGTLSFSPALDQFEVSDGYYWDSATNTYQGDVFANLDGTTDGTSTLTLPADTQAFYLYSEPNQLATYTIKATSDSGATQTVSVNPFNGAQFFGFYGTKGSLIKSVTVTNPDGQGAGLTVGEFGINEAEHFVITSTANPANHLVVDDALLVKFGVPASQAPLVLNDLAYVLRQAPANPNYTITYTTGLGTSFETPSQSKAVNAARAAIDKKLNASI